MSRTVLIVIAVIFGTACSGPGLPSGLAGPGLYVTGTYPADTIDARSVPELEVIAYDADGKAMSGVTVSFTPDNMFMAGTLDQEPWIGQTSRTSNSDGKAAIRFKRGDHTTTGRIFISMSDSVGHVFADTVTFDILPGHAVPGHTAAPRDTALYIGRTFQLTAGGLDRNGDAVPLAATYTLSPGLQISSTGVVTTSDYGRNFIVAATTAGSDTASVSVVPQGTLIGSNQIIDLDGTNRHPAPWSDPADALWMPDGQHILVSREFALGSMQIVDLQGNASHFGPDSLDHASSPSISGDGSKILFLQYKDSFFTLWRTNADGSNAIKAAPFFVNDAAASFDGSLAAIVTGPDSLRVYSVPNGVPQSWTQLAVQPRWSPDGKWIAMYLDRQNIGVVVDAVTGAAVLQFGNAGPRTWSPDSQWLLTSNALVRITDGRTIPLPSWTSGFTFDTWKSTP